MVCSGPSSVATKSIPYRFGKSLAVVAKYHTATSLACISPVDSTVGSVQLALAVEDDVVSADADSPFEFNFYATPVVIDVEPTNGALSGGTLVTIHGTGFDAGQGMASLCRLGKQLFQPRCFLTRPLRV